MTVIKNLPQFQSWIRDILQDKMPEEVAKLQKVIALDLFRRIVFKSPVGNPDNWAPTSLPPPPGYVGGRFRANWQVTVGRPATGVLESTGEPPPPNVNVNPYGVIWITNNVPYAERLELGWSRTQAPGGVVNIAISEVLAAF